MKKQFISMVLLVVTLFNLLVFFPNSNLISYADTTVSTINYNDQDVKWLGTTVEYEKTIKAFFDNGIREVKVGEKYGLVDISGKYVAEPIYDQIEAIYVNEDGNTNQSKREEEIFVNGYVQAVRNGKMGLLDTNGKEVIPCNYDSVGLPSEGVSRITRIVNGVIYLGYWNLELGKEIVAPNKYIVPQMHSSAATPEGSDLGRFDMPVKEDGSRLAGFDFNGGYALVPTGKVERVVQREQWGIHSSTVDLCYAQIIDKNGNEVLKGGPYPFNATPRTIGPYPQSGPYMVYVQMSTKKISMITDAKDEIVYTSHLESGVVGPTGIIIPAQYHGGIWGNSATGWYVPGARMQIIAEKNLVITLKCGYDKIKEAAALQGVINLNNKEVIPFISIAKAGAELAYDKKNDVFYGFQSQLIYRPNGTKIVGTDKRASQIINGHVILGEDSGIREFSRVDGFISIKDGKSYTHVNLKGNGTSNVSKTGTVWIKKNNKWGLVKLDGSIILPFEYDELRDNDWISENIEYAIVRKNDKWGIIDSSGKILLPVNYKDVDSNSQEGYINIQDYSTGKYGIYSLKASKITVNPIYGSSILSSKFIDSLSGSILGTVSITVGNSLKALLDMDTGKQLTNTYLSMYPINRGLFWSTYGDIFGPDGKILFSRAENFNEYTLVIKDGKIGAIHGSRLKIDGKLPTTSLTAETKEIIHQLHVVAYPEKQVYALSEKFDPKGIIVHHEDQTGARTVLDNSKLKFITSDGVEIKAGSKFTSSGQKTIEVHYNNIKADSFKVYIIPESAGNLLESGDYYIQIYGKYLYPNYYNGTYKLELWDRKPPKPYTIKLIGYMPEKGPQYRIIYAGLYIGQMGSKDGMQLQSAIDQGWRINKYTDFVTIRDYGSQKLLVNAEAQRSANGTRIIISTSTGSAPANAKFKFIPAD